MFGVFDQHAGHAAHPLGREPRESHRTFFNSIRRRPPWVNYAHADDGTMAGYARAGPVTVDCSPPDSDLNLSRPAAHALSQACMAGYLPGG